MDIKTKIEARLENKASYEGPPKNISQMKKLKPGTKIKLVKGDKRGFYYGRFEKGKEYELLFTQRAMIFNSEVGLQAMNYPKKTEVEFTEKGFVLKPKGLAVSWTPEEFEFTQVVY